MSEHGAALQTYNQELVKCLEDLKSKRLVLQEVIDQEELEKQTLERNIKSLQEKLAVLSSSLNQHLNIRDRYDATIKDTEAGFKKILETSQALLNCVQQQCNRLETKNH